MLEGIVADLQEAARRNLTAKAWAYMKSGATDERSKSPAIHHYHTSPSLSSPLPIINEIGGVDDINQREGLTEWKLISSSKPKSKFLQFNAIPTPNLNRRRRM